MQVGEGGGGVEYLTETNFSLRNVPGGGGGEKFQSFFSLLNFFSKMFLGF